MTRARVRVAVVTGAATAAVAVAGLAPAAADTAFGPVQQQSLGAYGGQPNGSSGNTSMTRDGRYLAFDSAAIDLVRGGAPPGHVYLKDRSAGVVTLVSRSSSGVLGNDGGQSPVVAAGGGLVYFTSLSSNLVAGDTNSAPDVFVRDIAHGTTRRVSLGDRGQQADAAVTLDAVTADGRYVSFSSSAGDLVPGDTNGHTDVFVRDTVAQTTRRVSLGPGGRQGDGDSGGSSLSDDGRSLVFTSSATDLTSSATRTTQAYVRDLSTGVNTSVSRGMSSGSARLSASGRYVTFLSRAALTATKKTGYLDVFLLDRSTSTLRQVSVGRAGTQSDGGSSDATPSDDGRYVLFLSLADDLVAGDTNRVSDAFLRDVSTGTTTRVSVAPNGAQGAYQTVSGTLTPDSRHLVLDSESQFRSGDTAYDIDVFTRDR